MTMSILHYDVHGSGGPYLLMVHGILSSRAQWMDNIPSLSEYCRPVVVELLGHGRSPSPEDTSLYTPDGYLRQFEELRLELDVDRWLICGASLGAALTLRYALDFPDRVIGQVFTNSMSALAAPGWREAVHPIMQAQAERLAREGRGAIANHPLNPARASRIPVAVRDALVADSLLHDPSGVALTGLHTVPGSSVRERVASNRVPTLLVAGEREERFREYRLYAEENIPQLSVVTFDAGHAVNAEAPAEFNRDVSRFFAPLMA